MRRLGMILFFGAVIGCGKVDGPGSDAPASSPATSCPPIVGTAPFAVQVSGDWIPSEPIEAGTSTTIWGELWFPRGRVAGAPVVFATGTGSGLSFGRSTLGADLGAEGLEAGSSCYHTIIGRLVGPSGGIDASATVNFDATRSDVLEEHKGTATLCAAGTIPPPKWGNLEGIYASAIGGVRFFGAFPLDLETIASIKVRSGTRDVPFVATELEDGGLWVQPSKAFPVFDPLVIDVTGVREAAGRAVPAIPPILVAHPSAVVGDLTFGSAATPGSIAGEATIADGKLTSGVSGNGIELVIGLGSGTGTKLRVRHRLVCTDSTRNDVSVMIIGGDGIASPMKPSCSDLPVDQTVSLPGVGPWVLEAYEAGGRITPCEPPYAPTFAPYEIDEIAFEK